MQFLVFLSKGIFVNMHLTLKNFLYLIHEAIGSKYKKVILTYTAITRDEKIRDSQIAK